MEDESRAIFGVQFHPEVATRRWRASAANFLFAVCGCRGDWSPEAVVKNSCKHKKSNLGLRPCRFRFVGGVDSTCRGARTQSVGDRQTCIFVDNGLLREGEFESTLALLRQSMKLNIVA
jgi:GMP synthase (glutamine-hydrolysing)